MGLIVTDWSMVSVLAMTLDLNLIWTNFDTISLSYLRQAKKNLNSIGFDIFVSSLHYPLLRNNNIMPRHTRH